MTEQVRSLDALGQDRLHRLLEISTLLSSTRDLSRLLNMVIEVAAEVTDCEEASLLLIDNKGELRFVATTNMPKLVDVVVPMEGSLAGWVVLNGEPLLHHDVPGDDRHYSRIDLFTDVKTRTLLAVPLTTQERIIGVMEVINKKTGSQYSPQDISMLQALSSQAAVAIENARLFQQSDAVAEVMHELKTPLLALTAATELLNRPQLPEDKRQKIVYTVQEEAKRLAKMTQDFLQLARLDSGRVQIVREPVDLVQLAHEVVSIETARAAQKDVALKVDVVRPVPRPLADPDKLKQVLLNFVSNAIKYNTENGTVTIRVEKGHSSNEAQISVIDTGRGIAAEDLEHLFERFYRVPGSEGYSEGTGLGLSIAKRIVEALDGRIEVESELGKGTTFRCILPVGKK